MSLIELLLNILFNPIMFVCVLVGIGLALLFHRLVPAAPAELGAMIVALSCFVGLLVSWSGFKGNRK